MTVFDSTLLYFALYLGYVTVGWTGIYDCV